MNRLERYILMEFAKLLAISMGAFILLFVIVDVFENIGRISRAGAPSAETAAYFIYRIPFTIGQVSPIAVLLAALLSLGLLSKHNEITAIKAGGVRMFRVITPLLAAGMVISVGVMLINETVTPGATRRADAFHARWLEGVKGSTGLHGVWMKTDTGIFNISHIDTAAMELKGVRYFEVDRGFAPVKRIEAKRAVWVDEAWVAPSATVWEFTGAGGVAESTRAEFRLPGPDAPERLTGVETRLSNMGLFELARYTRKLKAEGYDTTRAKIDLYGKLTFPLVNFIMVLVGVPFALKTGRHSGIAVGVGLSVAIAFSYWVVFAITRSLGYNGIVPPILAAAFPDVLFAAVGVLMYGHVRQ